MHGKKGAAEILGINPSTLRPRMEKLDGSGVRPCNDTKMDRVLQCNITRLHQTCRCQTFNYLILSMDSVIEMVANY